MFRSMVRSLYAQVLFAVVAGALVGAFYPVAGEAEAARGCVIKLVKMLIGPIISCTVVLGISGMEDMKKVAKTGGLALIYFEVVSTLALLIGLVVVNVAKPGAGVNADPATLAAAAVAQYADKTGPHGVADFILNIIPTTLANAFATGEVLQVLLVSVLFGFALHALGERGDSRSAHPAPVQRAVQIVGYIMRLAPIGASVPWRSRSASTASACFRQADGLLLRHLPAFHLRCARHHRGRAASASGACALHQEELFTSSHVLIGIRAAAHADQARGTRCRKPCRPRHPTGYFNGTAIYLDGGRFYRAGNQAPLGTEQLALRCCCSRPRRSGCDGQRLHRAGGNAFGGRPRAGHRRRVDPGHDRFMSEARALTNLIGNGVATVVIGKWCGQLDEEQLRRTLGNGQRPPPQRERNEGSR
jgi:aerobic C4-dicarboxylate transport protein